MKNLEIKNKISLYKKEFKVKNIIFWLTNYKKDRNLQRVIVTIDR